MGHGTLAAWNPVPTKDLHPVGAAARKHAHVCVAVELLVEVLLLVDVAANGAGSAACTHSSAPVGCGASKTQLAV